MKSLFVLIILVLLDFVYGASTTSRQQQSTSIEYRTKHNQFINIDIMFHMDPMLTVKLAKEYGLRSRHKLKAISRNILTDVGKFFQHRSLNQTIRFKLLDTRFIKNTKNKIRIDENASKYLKSYCDWQSSKKFAMKKLYFSVLLTGLDLYYVNSRGEQVRRSTGRSYMSSMCSMKKSCTLIEWHPKNIGFLLAHEIAHSLNINHDDIPYNHCRGNHIMSSRYNDRNHPRSWSECSQKALKRFIASDRSWCTKPEYKMN